MKKRLLAVLMAISMLAGFSSAASANVVDSGKCGENLTWTYFSNNTLKIEGTGEMYNFIDLEMGGGSCECTSPWYKKYFRADIILTEGMTSIGDYSGISSDRIRGKIPASVKRIGTAAFFGGEDFKIRLEFAENSQLEEIADNAFSFVSSVSMEIPASVKIIGSNPLYEGDITFEKGSKLQVIKGDMCLDNIVLPSSLKRIEGSISGNFSFPSDCQLEYIAPGALDNTEFYNNHPDGIVYAGNVLYKYKGNMPSGMSINIKKGTKSITDNAFYNCTGLCGVNLPASVKYIGEKAFYGCRDLEEISFADENALEYAGGGAFRNTPFYNSIADGPVYIGNIFYEYKGSMPAGSEYTIKEGTEHIAPYAFTESNFAEEDYEGYKITDNTALVSVTIPSSVKTTGKYAFGRCINLQEVIIPADSNIDYIGKGAFFSCSSLNKINFSEKLKTVEKNAFGFCRSLKIFDIPENNNIEYIGENAFSGGFQNEDKGCKFESLSLPHVKYIGDNAFSYCTALKSLKLSPDLRYIGTVMSCFSLEEINVPVENNFYCTEDGVLYSGGKQILYKYPEAKKDKSFTPDVKTEVIWKNSISNVCYLEKIDIPAGTELSVIRAGIYNCSALKDINPEICTKLTFVEGFFNCPQLTALSIPASVGRFDGGNDSIKKLKVYNPGNCYLYELSLAPDCIIYGYKGSDAQRLAEMRGLEFIPFGESMGDTDGDNEITAADARLTLRNSVGLEVFNVKQKNAGDVDGDKVITAADARIILRVSVELDEI